MTVGDYIKRIRETNGGKGFWSRLAVSNRAGISDSYLFQLESNQNTKPTPEILQKLSGALKVNYEDLMRAAGYLPPEKESPKTIELPLCGECPADKFNFAFEEITDTIEINWDLVKDKAAFCLRVRGDCLRDIGIYDNDFVIISPQAEIKNGDIIVARVGDECTMKKFYKSGDQIILYPCNHDYEPIILKPKQKDIEIIGKIIRAIKNL